ncbi:Frataxin [Polyporus arcularius HHB13444]|uniref:ferroxidase n=1 Tax=Polyporus arcularius HHB13444 TaxID=1314778 RepID=A0A5C3PI48_9APHY|nr:Frataxin [Polyporus arcularius HHB13444]
MSLRQATRTTARSLSVLRRVSHSHAVRALHSLSEHRVDVSPRTQRPPRRSFATPPPQVKHSDLPIEQYHQYSDATMDKMLESLENLLDELADPEYEVEYGSGVLTLKLGSKGTYVINKQPPNKQIWLSSPFSGPKRYDYAPEQDEWVYYRDGRSLSDLLNQELSDALGRKVDLGLTDVSTQLS